jgi:iron(III) transport system substrate-binding protein
MAGVSVSRPRCPRETRSIQAEIALVCPRRGRLRETVAERVFQRIGQEYSSSLYRADVVNSSDAAHFIVWKREGILGPCVPDDVAKFYPADHKDSDGMFASFRVTLSSVGYNTNLVKAEEAPKSFADLLDPKWMGKIVKALPAYSGRQSVPPEH